MDCPEVRQLHFTMPLHLEIARNQSRPATSHNERQQNWGAKAIQDAFGIGKSGGKKGTKGKKDGPKGGGKKGLKSKAPGPNGKRKICYSFNNKQGCDGSCGMVHICQICGGEDHGKSSCPTLKQNGPPQQRALA